MDVTDLFETMYGMAVLWPTVDCGPWPAAGKEQLSLRGTEAATMSGGGGNEVNPGAFPGQARNDIIP
jgi:hypothetical protein